MMASCLNNETQQELYLIDEQNFDEMNHGVENEFDEMIGC